MEIIDQYSRIKRISENEYSFHFEKYLSEGWNLFRKAPLLLALYTLIFLCVITLLNFIPLIGAIVCAIVIPILIGGFYVGIKKLDDANSVEIGDFFESSDNWLQLFVFGVVSGLLVSLGYLLLVLPGIWFSVAILFGYPLVVFAKIEFWDSIKISANIINKKWFNFFGLVIVLILINIVGTIPVGLGLFITIPFSFATIYACYKDRVGFGITAERDITDHLVDDL